MGILFMGQRGEFFYPWGQPNRVTQIVPRVSYISRLRALYKVNQTNRINQMNQCH
jgi:hypothetical protein